MLRPLLLALLVAACAAPRPEPEATPPAVPETEPAGALPEASPPPPSPADANRLLGLEPRHIQDILGTPGLVRREGAAQVMQFKNGNCVLDVVFYEEAAGGAFLARHLASRLLDGAPIAPGDCLTAILPDGRFPPGALPVILPVAPEPVTLPIAPEEDSGGADAESDAESNSESDAEIDTEVDAEAVPETSPETAAEISGN